MIYDSGVNFLMCALVQPILEKAHAYPWSWQGFGMLRLYLANEHLRLHVWDAGQATPNVSPVHNHPWAFRSWVLAGRLENHCYMPHDRGEPWRCREIRCGEGGGPISNTRVERLAAFPPVGYGPGESYTQAASDLHETVAQPGTVTIIRRDFRENRDLATVYWRDGDWVSAEPRPAAPDEVERMRLLALARLTEVMS